MKDVVSLTCHSCQCVLGISRNAFIGVTCRAAQRRRKTSTLGADSDARDSDSGVAADTDLPNDFNLALISDKSMFNNCRLAIRANEAAVLREVQSCAPASSNEAHEASRATKAGETEARKMMMKLVRCGQCERLVGMHSDSKFSRDRYYLWMARIRTIQMATQSDAEVKIAYGHSIAQLLGRSNVADRIGIEADKENGNSGPMKTKSRLPDNSGSSPATGHRHSLRPQLSESDVDDLLPESVRKRDSQSPSPAYPRRRVKGSHSASIKTASYRHAEGQSAAVDELDMNDINDCRDEGRSFPEPNVNSEHRRSMKACYTEENADRKQGFKRKGSMNGQGLRDKWPNQRSPILNSRDASLNGFSGDRSYFPPAAAETIRSKEAVYKSISDIRHDISELQRSVEAIKANMTSVFELTTSMRQMQQEIAQLRSAALRARPMTSTTRQEIGIEEFDLISSNMSNISGRMSELDTLKFDVLMLQTRFKRFSDGDRQPLLHSTHMSRPRLQSPTSLHTEYQDQPGAHSDTDSSDSPATRKRTNDKSLHQTLAHGRAASTDSKSGNPEQGGSGPFKAKSMQSPPLKKRKHTQLPSKQAARR